MTDAKFLFAPNAVTGKAWSMVLLQGILFLILGIVCLWRPLVALMAVALLVGALLVFYGVERLMLSRKVKMSGWSIFWTILAILVGLFCFFAPLLASIELALVIGIWMVFGGVDQLSAASHVASGTPGRSLMFVNGALSLILGFLVFLFPLFGSVVIGYMIGFYLLFFGVVTCAAAMVVKKANA